MKKISFIALALAALLSGCASTTTTHEHARWNGGVWNSVLGYHGPANTMADAGGP